MQLKGIYHTRYALVIFFRKFQAKTSKSSHITSQKMRLRNAFEEEIFMSYKYQLVTRATNLEITFIIHLNKYFIYRQYLDTKLTTDIEWSVKTVIYLNMKFA